MEGRKQPSSTREGNTAGQEEEKEEREEKKEKGGMKQRAKLKSSSAF